MKRVLFIATVVKQHIIPFHTPYLKMFKDNGYEVHVAARNDYENEENCSIPYCDQFYDLPFERFPIKKNNIKVYNKLKKILNQTSYDVIHCHTPVGGALGRLASIEARKKGTKVIYTAHGFHFYQGAPLINWFVYYPIEKILSNFTDVLITINDEDFRRAKKFNSKKTLKISGVGIDLKVNKKTKANIRKNLSISPEDVILISVGEINVNKNHEIVIRALGELSNPTIHYLICGVGDQKEKLERLIVKYKLEKQVHLLGFRNDINGIYKECDAFIFPSFREGLSLSLMEAMANGLLAIVSNIRGNVDLIDDGLGGFLFEPTNYKKLSILIDNVVKNKDLREKFGEYNLRKIKNFSIEKISKEMKDVYGIQK